MTELVQAGLEPTARRLARAGQPYAVATVVRTLASTAAKPGAKALLDADGTILAGFLGGGCVQGALRRTARAAIATGTTRFLSLRPSDLLEAEGVAAGEVRAGVEYARNGCPSQGALDIFIEPVLPQARLAICGTGPVACALARLAEGFALHRVLCGPGAEAPCEDRAASLEAAGPWTGADYVVVATQGAGDAASLKAALAQPRAYIAFVGSRRKFAVLAERLAAEGVAPEALAQVHAPAGLDIQAITPEEIALSILAEITQARRSGARRDG